MIVVRSSRVLVLLMIAFVWSSAARARAVLSDGPTSVGSRGSSCAGQFVLEARYRFRTVGLSDFVIDDQGTQHGQTVWGEHRLRVDPWISFFDTIFVRGQVDLFSGPIFGEHFDVGTDYVLRPLDDDYGLRRLDPRQLWLEWRAPFGRLMIGQMTSRWGLGILANDGEYGDRESLPGMGPDAGPVFGDRYLGDIVDRVLVAVPPIALFSDAGWARRLVLALAFDVVFRDENADLMRGDLALQGTAALTYRGAGWTAGAYVVYRNQKDREAEGWTGRYRPELQVTAVDVFGRLRLPLDAHGTALELAAEGVATVGHTDRAKPERASNGMDVLGFGGVLRASVEWPEVGLYPTLELGFASGDNDRGDDVNRAFSFDPDHRVGLILFEQVLSRMSARSSDRIEDPALSAQFPAGARWVPTNGSVTNAFYVYPTVAYQPAPWVGLRLGLLYAMAPADVVDPYASAERGGYSANYLGSSGGRSLGVEVDAGATFSLGLDGAFEIRLGVEGAAFFPGDALSGLDNIYTIRGGLDLLL